MRPSIRPNEHRMESTSPWERAPRFADLDLETVQLWSRAGVLGNPSDELHTAVMPLLRILCALVILGSPTLLGEQSQPGAFVVSRRTVTVTRPDDSTFLADLRYPATSTEPDAPFADAAAPAPAIAFGHGFLCGVALYASTMEHLASHGFIVIAMHSHSGLIPDHSQYAIDLRHCLTWLEEQDAEESKWLFEAVDTDRLAVSGHSMGGGAAMLAAAADDRIDCLATLAAAETRPSAVSAARDLRCPACFIVGSDDAIVPPTTTRAQYLACREPRQFVTIAGGSHCGFLDDGFLGCDSGTLPRPDQLARTRAALLEFFSEHLRRPAESLEPVQQGATDTVSDR